jgi:rare lipoprotein A (peptidoglycan hydrolase)
MNVLTFLCAGIASWFQPLAMYHGMNVCAMNVVPPSTRVVVLNLDNHRSASCTVIGTGPVVPGRVVDVSPEMRDALGFDGLADVVVYRVTKRLHHCRTVQKPVSCKTRPPDPCIADLPTPALVTCK